MSEKQEIIEKREKLLQAERLFEALSGVDANLLERSETESKQTGMLLQLRRFTGVAAAIFCLLVLSAGMGAGVRFFTMPGGMGRDGAPALAEDAVSITTAETAMIAESIEEAAGTENGISMAMAIAEEEAADIEPGNASGATVEKEKLQERTEVSDAAKAEKKDAWQEVCGVEPVRESVEEEEEQPKKGLMIDRADNQNGTYAYHELTGEEAAAIPALGAYLPIGDMALSEYAFESAIGEYMGQSDEVKSITICFTKGLDSVLFTASRSAEILYDTKTKEEDSSVFAFADLTKEKLEKLMKPKEDRGDTNTPSGSFSVIYDTGIRLEVNGSIEPDLLWKILQDLSE